MRQNAEDTAVWRLASAGGAGDVQAHAGEDIVCAGVEDFGMRSS
jgi:hypothetical protein